MMFVCFLLVFQLINGEMSGSPSHCEYNSAYEPRLYSSTDGHIHLKILLSARRLRLYTLDNITSSDRLLVLHIDGDLASSLPPVTPPDSLTWLIDYVRFYQLDSFTKSQSNWYVLCSDFKMFQAGASLNCSRCYALPLATSVETADSDAQVVKLAGNLYNNDVVDNVTWWTTDILVGPLPTPYIIVSTVYYERYVNTTGTALIQQREESLPPNSISILNTTLTKPPDKVEFFSIKATVAFHSVDWGTIAFATPYHRTTYINMPVNKT